MAGEDMGEHAKLAVRGMCLTLGSRVVLGDVSFDVAQGEVFGILGPNGAGKTSFMRCLTGLTRPERGTVWLEGKPVNARDRVLRAQLGVVFQEPSLDGKLTASENLRLGAALFGIGRREARQRAAELLAFMELADRADEPAERLSGGMRRRLELARALIHRPAVLLLDEPTTGLDPYAFERTWQLLLGLRRLQGLTMVLSTHRAEEAARCDRLLIFDRGHVVACDTPDALRARCSGDVVAVEADNAEEVAQQLRALFSLHCWLIEDTVFLECVAGHALIPRLVEAFPPGRLRSVSLRRPNLADAFFKLTGVTLGDAGEVGERNS